MSLRVRELLRGEGGPPVLWDVKGDKESHERQGTDCNALCTVISDEDISSISGAVVKTCFPPSRKAPGAPAGPAPLPAWDSPGKKHHVSLPGDVPAAQMQNQRPLIWRYLSLC